MNKHVKMKQIVMLTLLFIFYCEGIYAQEQLVTVDLKNATLKKVFKVIEQQTSYRFSYRNEVIDNREDITIKKHQASITEILDKVLEKRNLNYSIVSTKSIVIFDRKEQRNPKKAPITGTIKDALGDPIVGANVMIKGTSIGVITDIDGNFSLETPVEGTLVVSYIGYIEQELPLKGKNSFSVVLQEDMQALDEVVVIGYGTQKKMDLSSSIATLSTDDIGKLPNGLQTGLQSSVSGVQITNGRIRIRGVGSINDTDPLYVIDGMISGAIPDENNIESIQVLKDAASCAIYGARGANGVILINTKRGIAGKVKVEYNGYAGIKELQHSIDLLNGKELAELVNEEMYNADPSRTDYMKSLSDPVSIGKGYNMLNALKRTGFYQKHNLSLNGGSKNAHFRINGNYSSDQPTFIKEDNQNFGLQFISDFVIGKFKFGE